MHASSIVSVFDSVGGMERGGVLPFAIDDSSVVLIGHFGALRRLAACARAH